MGSRSDDELTPQLLRSHPTTWARLYANDDFDLFADDGTKIEGFTRTNAA